MHLERRSSPSQAVCYTDQLAALRSDAFGNRPTLSICWGEPPDSNLILDILCDRARSVPLGISGKGLKNEHPRVQILHVVYEMPLQYALSAEGTDRFMRQCLQRQFKHNLCGVHSDIYPEIVRTLLEQRNGHGPIADKSEEGVTLFYPMDVGDQPRIIIFDSRYCPVFQIDGE